MARPPSPLPLTGCCSASELFNVQYSTLQSARQPHSVDHQPIQATISSEITSNLPWLLRRPVRRTTSPAVQILGGHTSYVLIFIFDCDLKALHSNQTRTRKPVGRLQRAVSTMVSSRLFLALTPMLGHSRVAKYCKVRSPFAGNDRASF